MRRVVHHRTETTTDLTTTTRIVKQNRIILNQRPWRQQITVRMYQTTFRLKMRSITMRMSTLLSNNRSASLPLLTSQTWRKSLIFNTIGHQLPFNNIILLTETMSMTFHGMLGTTISMPTSLTAIKDDQTCISTSIDRDALQSIILKSTREVLMTLNLAMDMDLIKDIICTNEWEREKNLYIRTLACTAVWM